MSIQGLAASRLKRRGQQHGQSNEVNSQIISKAPRLLNNIASSQDVAAGVGLNEVILHAHHHKGVCGGPENIRCSANSCLENDSCER